MLSILQQSSGPVQQRRRAPQLKPLVHKQLAVELTTACCLNLLTVYKIEVGNQTGIGWHKTSSQRIIC
jgi:hypothetical protein